MCSTRVIHQRDMHSSDSEIEPQRESLVDINDDFVYEIYTRESVTLTMCSTRVIHQRDRHPSDSEIGSEIEPQRESLVDCELCHTLSPHGSPEDTNACDTSQFDTMFTKIPPVDISDDSVVSDCSRTSCASMKFFLLDKLM
ncbi:hypothetical protein NPIL_197821 [Nephila pilipes]|uniref:Protein kinase C-terminal domain-containing protein n=1 Tax=Nephila pilipes TaxID=299642 RepID=A0A8X6QCM6_NEPPI|nr:hypothetical protein NPIL_197821 [Nephila pilipes]